jgi:hypothetical protein
LGKILEPALEGTESTASASLAPTCCTLINRSNACFSGAVAKPYIKLLGADVPSEFEEYAREVVALTGSISGRARVPANET